MDNSSGFFFDPSISQGNMLFMGHNNNNLSFQGPRRVVSMEENQGSRKRPFFTSSSLDQEVFYDEEFYDEQQPEKKRRLTPEQVRMLEKNFEKEKRVEPERKSELAKELGLHPRQVAVWFQNRRARSKTKQLEIDYDLLKSSYDDLLSNYQTIVNHNQSLKYQVHSLTEKLQEVEKSGSDPKSDPIEPPSMDVAQITAQQQLSSGSSGTSVVMNEENPQVVVNSRDSTFFDSFSPPPCITTIRSHEDDISDDDRSYFPGVYNHVSVGNQKVEEEEEEGPDLGWWVWS